MFNSILVPLDGSDVAEKIIADVKAMAKTSGAEVVLLRVARAKGIPGSDPTEREVRAIDRAEKYLGYMAEELTREGFKVSTHVRWGHPAKEILKHSDKVDLVAMGTHGRTGIDRWALGSVATRVVRHSNKPVLLVRA